MNLSGCKHIYSSIVQFIIQTYVKLHNGLCLTGELLVERMAAACTRHRPHLLLHRRLHHDVIDLSHSAQSLVRQAVLHAAARGVRRPTLMGVSRRGVIDM